MVRYYVLDYVDEMECELVYDGQLYQTEEAASAARDAMSHPEMFDITWYTLDELQNDVFGGCPITITEDLKVVVME